MAATIDEPMSPSNTPAGNELPIKLEAEELNHTLTPPATDEHSNRARSSSDLSDIHMDFQNDIGDIEPSYYFEGGKIPVFEPTPEQFKDFKKFIDKIDKYGMQSGIVKVVPPKEWRDNQPALDEMVKMIKVKNPIAQEFHGSQGTWTQANMEKQRTYNLPQWRSLCEESNHQPPARRGERRRNQERTPRSTPVRVAKPPPPPLPPGQKRPRGRPRKNPLPAQSAPDAQSPSDGAKMQEKDGTPQPLQTPEPSPAKSRSKAEATKKDDDDTPKGRGRQPKSVSSRRLRNKGETVDVVDEEAFKDFDYRIHDQDQWTVERCKELESAYWKSLTFNNPLYGADMPGSLFKDDCDVWNVAKLPNLLDVLGQKVPGVNTAYLYLGMWKATFAWHLEDVDLYSINYIHFGAPKQWYSISQEDARRFEKAMRTIWPQDAKNCDQFLRHKTYLISPQHLKSQFGIEVNRLVHYEGEFVITYPYGYHSGYNLGYNCAESVNFANEAWLEYGKVARKCNCEADSVWIDVYDIERKLRGEQTPEYYETEAEDLDEDDDDDDEESASVLTPPGSVKAQAKRPRKRKRDATDKGEMPTTVKKLRIKISSPSKEHCCLCPHDPPFEPLLPTDAGLKAHRRCASYTPETRIIEVDGIETVFGVGDINKARLSLKCQFCRSKRGSVFQCAEKRCTRAYHAMCATAAGVQIDTGPVPVFMEDGTEYVEEGHDFRCKFHRETKKPKFDELKEHVASLQANSLIKKYAVNLKKGDLVQARYHYGDVFGGYVLENWVSEESLLLDTYPKRDKVEVSYTWLLVLDPAKSKRPRPSPDAKPLPKELFTSAKTNEDPADVDKPKPDDPFLPESAFKWGPQESFLSAKIEPNPDATTTKADLSKPKSTWIYLGATSTEAKAQYTSDPAVPHHDPASNFLDAVKPAVPRPLAPRPTHVSVYPSGVNINAVNAVRHNQNIQLPRNSTAGKTNTTTTTAATTFAPTIVSTLQSAPAQRTSFVAGGTVDADALRSQQAFLHQSASAFKFDPMALANTFKDPPQRPMSNSNAARTLQASFEAARRPSQPAPGIDFFRKSHEAYQHMTTMAASAARPTGPPGLQTLGSSSQLSASANDKMSPPHRPVFSRSPSAQPSSSSKPNLLTPPSTSDSSGGLRSRSDSLKTLTKWPFIYETASQRPHVYHSPYSSGGGYTEAAFVTDFTLLPSTTPKTRSRSTSLMQDFLQKASPSQLHAVRGHARTVSTDKAVAKAREAERRMSESISRQQRLTGGAMSPIEMLPEGMLGDLGRPGSSGVFSDRASPFPDFNSHAHPQSSIPSADTAGNDAVSQQIISSSNSANGNLESSLSSNTVNTASFLDFNTATLGDLHYPRPTRTLNQRVSHGMFISADDFSKQLQQTSAQYPMGTKSSSYNKSMKDLESAAATSYPILKEPLPTDTVGDGSPRIPSIEDPATASYIPPQSQLAPVSFTLDNEKTQTINPSSIVNNSTDMSSSGRLVDNSPLKETLGGLDGGAEMLPMMRTNSYMN